MHHNPAAGDFNLVGNLYLDGPSGNLAPGSPPADVDGDGMADAWEPGHGLVVGLADHATVMPSGYTAIEQYVNELADPLVGQIFADGFETGDTLRWAP